jgi:hypothetical protein
MLPHDRYVRKLPACVIQEETLGRDVHMLLYTMPDLFASERLVYRAIDLKEDADFLLS